MTFDKPEHVQAIVLKLLPKLLKCERRQGIFRGFRKHIQFHQKQLVDLLEAIKRNEPLPPNEITKEIIQDAASIISTVNKMKSQEKK